MAWKFSEEIKINKVKDASSAATTDVTSDSVDMQGYDSVAFLLTFGTITGSAVTSIHVEQSANDSSFADLEGTNVTVADDDDNEMFWLEIVRPTDRYIRLIVDRGTQNAEVGAIYAFQTPMHEQKPIDNVIDDTITGESHLTPDEGSI